jgi:hypothetical protein
MRIFAALHREMDHHVQELIHAAPFALTPEAALVRAMAARTNRFPVSPDAV